VVAGVVRPLLLVEDEEKRPDVKEREECFEHLPRTRGLGE